MRYKFLALFFVIIILTEIVSSFNASSNDYSVDSFHKGISGGNASSSEHNSRFSSTYQQSGGKGENTNYTANIGWFSQPEFCGDGYCNAGEDCSTCSSDCGSCPSPAPSAPSAGAAGAAAACTYEWVCSEWYPEPCPSEEIQKRVCVNRGTCTGIVGMPSLTKSCIPEFIPPSEPLFDLFLRIPFGKKWISRGDTLETQIELINVGNITTIDVFFKYWIVDENNRLILEKQETRAIGERERFSVWFDISKDVKPGVYKVYVHITYDSKVALAGDNFEVFESRFLITRRIIFLSLIALSVLSGLIIIIIKILKKKEERERKVKQREITKLTRRLLRAKRKRARKIRRARKKKMRELIRAERKRKRKYKIERRKEKGVIRRIERKKNLRRRIGKLKMMLMRVKKKRKMRKLKKQLMRKHRKKRIKRFRIKRIKLKRKPLRPQIEKKKPKRKAVKIQKEKRELSEEIEKMRKKIYLNLLKKTVEMKKATKKTSQQHVLDSKVENLRGEVRRKGIKEAEIHKKKK